MAAILAALLLGFKTSASAAQTIYPSSYGVTTLTKGFKYRIGYTNIYRSSNPSVVAVSGNAIAARKIGACYIYEYSSITGQLLRAYPTKVKANKVAGTPYRAVNVTSLRYGNWCIPIKMAVKGKYLIIKATLVNNRLLRVRWRYVLVRCSVGGRTIVNKKVHLNVTMNRYTKKKVTLKVKLSKAQRRNLDLNHAYFY